MAHFITDSDRKEVRAEWWAEGETVTIKKFTYVDRQRLLERALVGPPTTDGEGNTRMRIDSALLAETTLVMGIVDWTLRDEDGEPVPCDSSHKCALANRDGLYLYGEIQAYNEERSAAERDNF